MAWAMLPVLSAVEPWVVLVPSHLFLSSFEVVAHHGQARFVQMQQCLQVHTHQYATLLLH